MEHSDYSELTRRLGHLARGADTLRVLFSKEVAPATDPGGRSKPVPTDEARQHPWFSQRMILLDGTEHTVEETAGLMDRCQNGWTASNQARADNERPATADVRSLYQAMDGFMSATSEPTPGIARLYDILRTRCREWMDQAVTWFPDLYPEFIRKLLASDVYKEAVVNGDITPPFIWNGTIKELAIMLANSGLLSVIEDFKLTGTRIQWSLADRVFLIKGKPVTARQLNDAFKH